MISGKVDCSGLITISGTFEYCGLITISDTFNSHHNDIW